MVKTRVWVAGTAAIGVALAAWSASGSPKLDELPAAVRATILKEAGTAKIEHIEKEAEPGKPVVYEAKWEVAEDHDREISVAEDGKLVSSEDILEMKLEATPAAVQATILKEAAGAKVSEVAQVTEGKAVTYEAEFKADGKEVEVTVAPDGKLIEREVKADDEMDDDD